MSICGDIVLTSFSQCYVQSSIIIIIFFPFCPTERPGLEAKQKVEKIQGDYVELLQAYENAKRGKGGNALARFLSRLSDLRTISVEHSKVLLELDIKKDGPDIPSVIKEIILLPPEGN